MLSKPLLLILSAPSGTGKTTLARRLVAANPGAIFSVSYTTRAPRGSEKEGVDYHFVSEERFQEMIALGAFVEWAHVHGHHYGTPKTVIAEAEARGALAVFDIDVQGGESIKKQQRCARWCCLPRSPNWSGACAPAPPTTMRRCAGACTLRGSRSASLSRPATNTG
jgi:guanylate kinase